MADKNTLAGLLGMFPTDQNTIAGLLNPPVTNRPNTIEQPALMNPMLARQGDKVRESIFQREIKQSPWYQEFIKQYNETPDISPNANYDYRSAWQSGIRPERDPYDNNRYHWPSALPSGQLLKSANHPTLWKELYMRKTGKNPDETGATIDDYLRLP